MSYPADNHQPRLYIHPVNARLSTYLINLDRAADRRKRMNWLLSRHGLVFERIQAVDGNDIALPSPLFDERGYLKRHGRLPNRGEIGCYMSHVECAGRLLASPFEHALILEDDLDFDEDLLDTLSCALDEAAHWDLLRLSSVNSGHKFPVLRLCDKYRLALTLTREKGSGAYIINRKAAAWITGALLPMKLPYDLAFDLEHEAGLSACFISPAPVSQSAEPISYIQNRLTDYRLKNRRPFSVWLHRARAECGRFIARSARLVVWRALRRFR
jgi:glycosyl transferase family 25